MERSELKARMAAHLGMDAESCAWVSETVRRLSAVEVSQELAFFRSLQG